MKVLFVCKENVFRSVTAEYCLRDYAQKNNILDIEAASAGIHARWEPVAPQTRNRLKKHGIIIGRHRQVRLSADLLTKFDLVVAMGLNHQQFIKEKFGKDVPLFNEIAYGTKTGVLDVDEVMPRWYLHLRKSAEHIRWTVDYIHEAMPSFVQNAGKFVK
jgi:protein-tyrosine-phosphatase